MVSKFIRRSGISVCLIADLLEWVPDLVIQVGVGVNPEETAVFRDAWPEHDLIGFEGHPTVYETALKSYPGQLFNFAIGDRDEAVEMWTPPRHKDGSSIFKHEGMENLSSCKTWMKTLSQVIPINWVQDRQVLLWLDCEGCELKVLDHGRDVLKHVAVVNVELTAKPISKAWCDSNQVHDLLLEAGFKRQWVHTQRTSAGQCDAIYVRPELFKAEFCCCPCQIEKE